MRNVALLTIVACGALGLSAPHAMAQAHMTKLFVANGKEGPDFESGVTQGPGGVLYGETFNPSRKFTTLGCGSIYSLTPPKSGSKSWTYSLIYAFPVDNGSTDGCFLTGDLVVDGNGAIYGTTAASGYANGNGSGGDTIFKLTPPTKGQTAWTHSVLYTGNVKYDRDFAVIVGPGGVLYGSNSYGAMTYGNIFQLSPPSGKAKSWTYSILYNFQGGQDGASPKSAPLLAEDGTLYVTTVTGGDARDGTVVSLTPPSNGHTNWTEKVLYSFTDNADSGGPVTSPIIDSAGNLYGTVPITTEANNGAVYELSPPASGNTNWTETTITSFTNIKPPYSPVFNAGVVMDQAGALYVPCGANVSAAIIKLTPPVQGETGWVLSTPYKFKGDYYPRGSLLVNAAGEFFGATNRNSFGAGSFVYSLTP